MSVLQLLNGIALGSLLMLISSGMAMIYGLRDVMNFAHGSLYMAGAYLAYMFSSHVSFWAGLIVIPLMLAGVGLIMEETIFRRLQHRTHIEIGLITFGIGLVLARILVLIWGSHTLIVSPPEPFTGTASLLGYDYPSYRLFIIVVSITIATALIGWIRGTRTGLHVRAASHDRETSVMLGVDVNRLSRVVVALGCALAGVAGALAAPYLSLTPSMGAEILVEVLIIVVIGGIGSFGGAMVAGMLLGIIQTIGAVWNPTFAAVAPYAALVVVLLWRPHGLAGKRL